MKASVIVKPGELPILVDLAKPSSTGWQLLVRVEACALCRTDLHILDNELPAPKYPLVLGHEIVGVVEASGDQVEQFAVGDRVGVPWLASACLTCVYCNRGQENLCASAKFTGYTVDGGFAEYTVADSRFCFAIPASYDASHAAPLLCAGLIGWRSFRFTGDAERVGIFGFGAAAHIVTPIASSEGRKVFAFTSPGDFSKQRFALDLGAVWAGGSNESAPEELDAAIIFAPVGALIPVALKSVRPGGIVVCGGIHMSDIPSFSYDLLWGERTIRSVANLTRDDGLTFFSKVAKMHIETHIQEFSLDRLIDAINEARSGKICGAAVVLPRTGLSESPEQLVND